MNRARLLAIPAVLWTTRVEGIRMHTAANIIVYFGSITPSYHTIRTDEVHLHLPNKPGLHWRKSYPSSLGDTEGITYTNLHYTSRSWP